MFYISNNQLSYTNFFSEIFYMKSLIYEIMFRMDDMKNTYTNITFND